jgi:hypothetical protein
VGAGIKGPSPFISEPLLRLLFESNFHVGSSHKQDEEVSVTVAAQV